MYILPNKLSRVLVVRVRYRTLLLSLVPDITDLASLELRWIKTRIYSQMPLLDTTLCHAPSIIQVHTRGTY